jgi:hypothetical protein
MREAEVPREDEDTERRGGRRDRNRDDVGGMRRAILAGGRDRPLRGRMAARRSEERAERQDRRAAARAFDEWPGAAPVQRVHHPFFSSATMKSTAMP